MHKRVLFLCVLSVIFFLTFSGCATTPGTTTTSYTVTFDSQGGTAVSSKTGISPSSTVGTLPLDPMRDNFGFAGWYTGTNGTGTEFTAVSAVTADITVYAKWLTATPGLHYTIFGSVYSVDQGTASNSNFIVIASSTNGLPVTAISNDGFLNCTSLQGIIIPARVTNIGGQGFANDSALTNMKLPDGLLSIGYNALVNCNLLKTLVIPDSVTIMQNGILQGCSGLTNLTLPAGMTNIGTYFFNTCSGLKYLKIPDGVRLIDTAAFTYCGGLTNITLSSSLTVIGNEVFSYCSSLTNLELPAGLTSIGEWAFNTCQGLTNITIPANVTNIGTYAFANCANIADLKMESLTAPTVGAYAFGFMGCTLHIHAAATGYTNGPWTNINIFSSVVTDL